MNIKSILPKHHNEEGSVSIPFHAPQLQYLHIHLPAYFSVKKLKYGLFILIGTCSLLYVIQFFVPKTLAYASSQSACVSNPVIFSQLVRPAPSAHYAVQLAPSASIGPLVLLSKKTCITPEMAPIAAHSEKVSIRAFGIGFLGKRITVQSEGAPKVLLATDVSKTISAKSILTFQLERSDTVFRYALTTATVSTTCSTVQTTVVCPLSELNLPQGTTNTVVLKRQFKQEPVTDVLQSQISTLEPVIVTSSSIAASETVYSAPTSLTLTFSKPVSAAENVTLQSTQNGKTTAVPTTTTVDGTTATVLFGEPLARNTTYTATLANATSTDESTLTEPYILSFTTSGGPKVASTNIAANKTSTSPVFRLQFDVPLDTKQNLQKFLTVIVNGTPVAATVTADGASVNIRPTSTLPKCTTVTITLTEGLVNTYGVGNGTAWQATTKTICQTTYNIGTSVQGRAITAYSFGTGASTVMFVGGTHGDEKSSVYTLLEFIEDLERSPQLIPANRTVIVIPNLNPDAFVSGSRLNARGIDLNRNFAANNWQTDVYLPGNVLKPGGGGTEPLSEPESAAIASFVLAKQPRVVLTYHAVARLVISNDSGDSFALAQKYASLSGFGALMNSASHGAFEYDSTGEFEDWLHDKHNLPALLVELATTNRNEFATHKQAMWAMVSL